MNKTLCALALTIPTLANAEQGFIELNGNDNVQTVDTIIAGPLPFITSYGVRTRATIEDNKTGFAVVPRLFYNVAGCLDLQIDAQLNKEVRYGVGLKCAIKTDDLK